MKNIKSTDPRKKKISAEFKKRFSCNKITLLHETETHFLAQCLTYNKALRHYDSQGEQEIPKAEIQF